MITLFLLLMGTPAFSDTPIHDILDPHAIDRHVDPCQDFYKFSCNGWMKDFKLPADKSRYWRQGNVLTDNVEEKLNKILADLPAADPQPHSSNEVKLAAFYQSCRAVKAPDAKGLEELKARLKTLEDVHNPQALAERLAELNLIGSEGLFEFYADQDPKDSNQMIAMVDRGGMSLPDVDYYLKDDAKSKEVREHYKEHIKKVL